MATPPDEFLCPITLTLMRDPVIGPDGHSYERTAITQWLQTNPHSPLTRQPMTVQMLQSNYSLKTAIERYTRGDVATRPTPRAKPAPKPKLAPRPQLLPPTPSAPPEPQPYVIQVFSPELQQPLLPVAVPVRLPPLSEAQRRRKFLLACICLTVIIIVIIIVSRLYESMVN